MSSHTLLTRLSTHHHHHHTLFSRLSSPSPSLFFLRSYTNPALSLSLSMTIPDNKLRHIPKSGTYPLGFKCGTAHAGVKASNRGKYPDIALIESVAAAGTAEQRRCVGAAVFTRNRFKAAPVRVSGEVLDGKGVGEGGGGEEGGKKEKRRRNGDGVSGVVINSGCANAVTGKKGVEDAWRMVRKVGELRGKEEAEGEGEGEGESSLVMSTGVIGQLLPIDKILNAIPQAHSNLSSSHASWLLTARAICTTDTFPKLISREFSLPSSPGTIYRITGIAKGAGMIHPNMATLLGVICTDAPIAPEAAKPLLTHAVNRSFNCISIDGDTSTNDTIALLANGAAGGKPVSLPVRGGNTTNDDYDALQREITGFTQSLAQLVVRDGEGATKFITVRVRNSPSYEDGRRIAATVARSPLVKTAMYGGDANWGRITCAIGYTEGIGEGTVVPERTSVKFVRRRRRVAGREEGEEEEEEEELRLLVNGEPEQVDEERAGKMLEDEDLEIVIDLGGGMKGEEGKGGEEAVYWFSDFSHEYVTINGDYRT